jgi:hypothetical protein
MTGSVPSAPMTAYRIRGAQPGEPWGFEIRAGDSVHRDTGHPTQFFRRIDKREDVYHERVVDKVTGDVIHERIERLSEHRGHGDARRPQQRH